MKNNMILHPKPHGRKATQKRSVANNTNAGTLHHERGYNTKTPHPDQRRALGPFSLSISLFLCAEQPVYFTRATGKLYFVKIFFLILSLIRLN